MDLGPVDRITTDAIGEPGARVFYIQARAGLELVTVIVEKQQVQLLAASVLELLEDAPETATEMTATETGPAVEESSMGLEEPLDPRWRAGRLSIGFDQDRDLFVLEVEEFQPDLEDLDDDDPRSILPGSPLTESLPETSLPDSSLMEGPEPESIRIWASPAQMLALSRHGAEVAARGRPTCQFCGNPIDAEGHACPAMNGHSKRD
jgi:uncharacterized repeat protein (TIGR03847 family)